MRISNDLHVIASFSSWCQHHGTAAWWHVLLKQHLLRYCRVFMTALQKRSHLLIFWWTISFSAIHESELEHGNAKTVHNMCSLWHRKQSKYIHVYQAIQSVEKLWGNFPFPLFRTLTVTCTNSFLRSIFFKLEKQEDVSSVHGPERHWLQPAIVKAGQKETGTSSKRKCMLSVGKHTNWGWKW